MQSSSQIASPETNLAVSSTVKPRRVEYGHFLDRAKCIAESVLDLVSGFDSFLSLSDFCFHDLDTVWA
ncbi:hypothetical protein RYX36_010843 [Vicia faba]